MQFDLNKALSLLERTPVVLQRLLLGLDEEWIQSPYGEDTFSPFDVIGHLLHGEQKDWMTRVNLILHQGEREVFQPWDRYAMYEESRGKSIDQLLQEFELARKQNLVQLRAMELLPAQLDSKGNHPKFGAVTLRQLLATWVTHDLNHIHQICKCMAWQYREEIGPWREYLTFMDR